MLRTIRKPPGLEDVSPCLPPCGVWEKTEPPPPSVMSSDDGKAYSEPSTTPDGDGLERQSTGVSSSDESTKSLPEQGASPERMLPNPTAARDLIESLLGWWKGKSGEFYHVAEGGICMQLGRQTTGKPRIVRLTWDPEVRRLMYGQSYYLLSGSSAEGQHDRIVWRGFGGEGRHRKWIWSRTAKEGEGAAVETPTDPDHSDQADWNLQLVQTAAVYSREMLLKLRLLGSISTESQAQRPQSIDEAGATQTSCVCWAKDGGARRRALSEPAPSELSSLRQARRRQLEELLVRSDDVEASRMALEPKVQDPVGGQASTIGTVMLRNIPTRCSRSDIVGLLDVAGFHGSYDLIYMPKDRLTDNNLGYVFINFLEDSVCKKFITKFRGMRCTSCFPAMRSSKVLEVDVARVQGSWAYPYGHVARPGRNDETCLTCSDEAFDAWPEIMSSLSGIADFDYMQPYAAPSEPTESLWHASESEHMQAVARAQWHAKVMVIERVTQETCPPSTAAQAFSLSAAAEEFVPRSRTRTSTSSNESSTPKSLLSAAAPEFCPRWSVSTSSTQLPSAEEEAQRSKRRRGVRRRNGHLQIASHLNALEGTDPNSVLVLHRVQRLGFGSAAALRAHFERYGAVEDVLLSNVHEKLPEAPGPVRIRPSGVALVVMASAEAAAAALAEGSDPVVAGCSLHLRLFEKRAPEEVKESEEDAVEEQLI